MQPALECGVEQRVGGKRRCGRMHHVVHPELRERVDDEFAHHVMAAARDFFGEDGAAHEQHGHCVGAARRDEQPRTRLTSCVSSSRKTIAVSGERIVPPIMAAMPIIAHKPGIADGNASADPARRARRP